MVEFVILFDKQIRQESRLTSVDLNLFIDVFPRFR